MTPISFLVGALTAAALLPLAIQLQRRWTGGLASLVVIVLLWASVPLIAALIAKYWTASHDAITEVDVANRPRQLPRDGYVQSHSCRSCHPHEYDSWHSSFHRTMTQVASPQAVVGDFDDVTLAISDRSYRLFQDGDRYFADIEQRRPDGSSQQPARQRREIVMTTGSHHMQAYWYTSDQGRLTFRLPFVWLRPEQTWVPEMFSFLLPHEPHPGDVLGSWNRTCINCHTTYGCQGGPEITASVNTRAAEFGIACEACHGPAEQHIQSNRDPLRRYRYHFSSTNDPTIRNPARMSHRQSSQVCGQCHSKWLLKTPVETHRAKTHGLTFRPGDDLHQELLIVQPTDAENLKHPAAQRSLGEHSAFITNTFWSDGMVRVTGREYNGLIDSPCYQRGEMSCLSCHRMHRDPSVPQPLDEWTDDQLIRGLRTSNDACVQCHSGYDEQLEQHTHHTAESAGSQCYNCHMPFTTYGLLKGNRSHMITSPSVQESLETGRPNACNQCHLDQSLAWTADHLEQWYDISPPASLTERDRSIAASVVWALSGDAGQRALMAWSFAWEAAREASGDDWQMPYLAQLLGDEYPAVRIVAYRALVRLPGFTEFHYDLAGTAIDGQQAARRVIERWRGLPKRSASADRSAVLLNAAGRINRAQFDRLLGQRDHRRVQLDE